MLFFLVWNSSGLEFQKSILWERFCFCYFINDIVTNISSNICHFADDTNLFIIVENPDMAAELLNMDLEKIMKWAKRLITSFNAFKRSSSYLMKK